MRTSLPFSSLMSTLRFSSSDLRPACKSAVVTMLLGQFLGPSDGQGCRMKRWTKSHSGQRLRDRLPSSLTPLILHVVKKNSRCLASRQSSALVVDSLLGSSIDSARGV